MDTPALITDNIAELLVKIIEFTHARQKILKDNINYINRPNYVPLDLAVDEFSNILNNSILEHIQNGRLVMRDTENVKFGADGSFNVKPITDLKAQKLLKEDSGKYLDLQTDKLQENLLNQRLATELLRQKQQANSVSD
jgi:flagellar basal body rod protein FlgB